MAAARELGASHVAVLELTRDGKGMLARAGVGLPEGVLGGVLPLDPDAAGARPGQRELDLGRRSSARGRSSA